MDKQTGAANMAKATKRFVKGQVIYYASANFAQVSKDVRLGVVIERQVDACGTKQVTFYNRGETDFIFGKSNNADSPALFATKEGAFEYLRSSSLCQAVCLDVYSDANRESFADFRSGKMRIETK